MEFISNTIQKVAIYAQHNSRDWLSMLGTLSTLIIYCTSLLECMRCCDFVYAIT